MEGRSIQRIVSLIPGGTEIVCALGFEAQLVGRSHECDFPESVKRLPVCTEPKFNPDGTSYQIDQRVKAILQESLSVYRVYAEKLRQLLPDVIVTQAQCEVCAVSLQEVERAVCEGLDSRPQIISLAPRTLSDIWADIARVAEALKAPERGRELLGRLKQRVEAITEKTYTLSERPTVVCIEWIEPLMATGNWMPELIEMAGGVNLFGETGKHSPRITWEQLLEKDPDIILVLPCGFNIQRTREDIPVLVQKLGWTDLRAVRKGQVYLADGNQYFNRPGPRMVESLEILAEILHPDRFRFGHQGTGWEYL
jgi:iron complex transport system substrate-binding protein